MNKSSYAYMMGSASRRALYTGACASLYERVWEHKNDQGGYFTSKYKCHRLVYFEQFENIQTAFDREDQIKGWRREKEGPTGGNNESRLERFGRRLVSGRTSPGWGAISEEEVNSRSLRPTRPLKKLRARLTAVGMTAFYANMPCSDKPTRAKGLKSKFLFCLSI